MFDYYLPPELIAQTPTSPRDSSKLLVIDKNTGHLSHHIFRELPKLLKPTDVLVFNDTKVIPARLHGTKTSGGHVEILLLRKREKDLWEVISHPGIKPGQIIKIHSKLVINVISEYLIQMPNVKWQMLNRYGTTPIPPYIHSQSPETLLRKQYQTVYAKDPGSAAAPTAGLHFTPRLLKMLNAKCQMENVTLHVGLGTFKSPTSEQIESGHLHSDWFELNSDTANALNQAKSEHRRIIAVGTTSCRVLETCSDPSGRLTPQTGDTDIFIHPPYRFKFVDGLITNFHLPKTSLLMLVSTLSSWEIVENAYQEAISQQYRFYSFGDACLFI